MLERFKRAMNYWMFAVSHPGYVLEIAQKDMHRVRISFYIILMFGILYTLTSYVLWRNGRLPMMETWIPFVPVSDYYFYQMFWTVPWMVITYLTIAGFIYMFTTLSGKEAFYEDALMISALSIAIPYLMFWWIPETFLMPVMGSGDFVKWPELFEIERKFIFPQLWHVALVTFGMRKVNNTNRLACLVAGIFSVLVFLIMWIPFMR